MKTSTRALLLAAIVAFVPAHLGAQFPEGAGDWAAVPSPDNPWRQIRGGVKVQEGELPFVVRPPFCTGTVIAPNWVLTAAHCVSRLSVHEQVRFRLGQDFDVRNIRFIRRVVIHPDYTETTGPGINEIHAKTERDIALIEVFRPFPVSPVKLLKRHEEPPSESAVTSAGWGRLDDGSSAPGLMRRDHSFLTPEDCAAAVGWAIRENLLCGVDENNRGVVNSGDSGGPMLVPTTGGWGQIGINVASWAESDGPDLAVRVADFLDFIEEHVSPIPHDYPYESEFHFPFFSSGQGWETEFVFVNAFQSSLTKGEMQFFSARGNPLGDPIKFDLPAGGSFTITAPGSDFENLTLGSASFRYAGGRQGWRNGDVITWSIGVRGFTRLRAHGNSTWLGAHGTATITLIEPGGPSWFCSRWGIQCNPGTHGKIALGPDRTYISIRNPHSDKWIKFRVGLETVGRAGSIYLTEEELYIGPDGLYIKGLHSLFPEYLTTGQPFRGSVYIMSEDPISIGAFEVGPGVFNGVPVFLEGVPSFVTPHIPPYIP